MRYLGEGELVNIGRDWDALTEVISSCVKLHHDKDFAQPIKPYLRFGDLTNRIIAMPAYIGGNFSIAGIKWIASFPKNIQRGIPRAHSLTVLNDANSGVPLALINATLISGIRTAAVSAYFLQQMLVFKEYRRIKVGMTGFGPVGKLHLEMLLSQYSNLIVEINIFDPNANPDTLKEYNFSNLKFVGNWQEAYQDADIFITCTVSTDRYINIPPKKGSLQLNVSLRDYQPGMINYMDYIVVDDWDEVCRENTDIEKMHFDHGLQKEGTSSLAQISALAPDKNEVVMFNPMGMAIFDIGIAFHYYNIAKSKGIGFDLN